MSGEFEELAMKHIAGEASESEIEKLGEFLRDGENAKARMKAYMEMEDTYTVTTLVMAESKVGEKAASEEMPGYVWNKIRDTLPKSKSSVPAARPEKPWWMKLVLGFGSVAVVGLLVVTQFAQSYRIQFADFDMEVRDANPLPKNVKPTYFAPDESSAFEQWQESDIDPGFDAKAWLDRDNKKLILKIRNDDGSITTKQEDLPADLRAWSAFIRETLSELGPSDD